MSEKITRRAFGAAVFGTAAALAVPASAQKASAPIREKLRGFAPPAPEDIDAHLDAALAGVTAQSAARWAIKLPEGSEPCTIYAPTIALARKQEGKK